MFEVEKKFLLTEEQIERVSGSAIYLGEKKIVDSYYDTPCLALTTHDYWLRNRNGQFNLKIPVNQEGKQLVDQYEELELEELIRKQLRLPSWAEMPAILRRAGYEIFCTLRTVRRKFQMGKFTLDLDSTDFGDRQYNIAEIELLVEDRAKINQAIEQILEFAQENKLRVAPVRGKVIEYIYRKRPEHFKALVKANVVKDLD